ncbi:DUF2306 domain-containing protein [Pseudoxanthomonas indica]|uniref:Predicted membrane protein n=1 Tax=Pseudoxanthomonas indica TaxID=428993 RepID=A0A1T5LN21_9GAMM|nr:DUF2306 domain-containing protein [Pseudoxanthomonas indica]GGD37153.1 hypothetical protein GCM10007235_06610 [Pseudoxanthomonas indica]SKC77356.1 Predicted membrane protein [Pseudoxanthomonas indica]
MSPSREEVASPQGQSLLTRVLLALALIALAAWCVDFLISVHAKYRHVAPATYTMFWTRRAWLWTHLAGGTLAIVLGLVQFLTQWPRAFSRVHRWTGRGYLAGILIASTGAVGLIATSPAPFAIRMAFAATAWAWLSTSLIGLVAIRRGQVQKHRRWMTRAWLVTLAPITFRLVIHTPGVMTLADPPDVIAMMLWVSWALPLLLFEIGRRSWALWHRRRAGQAQAGLSRAADAGPV